jgi:hypothetical protein
MSLVPMTPEDALDVFGKWADEDVEVFCEGHFFGCALRLRGKVSMRESFVQVIFSQDIGIRVDLNWEGLDLRYGEIKDFPVEAVPERAKTSGATAIGLPAHIDEAFREKLIFVELHDEDS